MYWGLQNNFLYTAYKIKATFRDDLGKELAPRFGTCLFVNDSTKTGITLLTNRHILDPNFKESTGKYRRFLLSKLEVSGKANDERGMPERDQHLDLSGFMVVPDNENSDVAAIRNVRVTVKQGEESSAQLFYTIDTNILATQVDFQSRIDVSDFVAFPGFPEWHDKRDNRPILRFGTIASDPRYNYSDNKYVFGDCIAYEAFSFDGSSGSPVFALTRGFGGEGSAIRTPNFRKLLCIGINAGHLETSDRGHSGISYLYKSSTFFELLDHQISDPLAAVAITMTTGPTTP